MNATDQTQCLARLASAVLAAATIECNRKGHKDWRAVDSNTLATELFKECNSDTTYGTVAPEHIQVLMAELDDVCTQMRIQLVEEMRESIKDELRAELLFEMSALRGMMQESKAVTTAAEPRSAIRFAPFMLGTERGGAAPLRSDDATVQKQVARHMDSSIHIDPVVHDSAREWNDLMQKDRRVEALEDNPLFKLVSRSVDRSRQGVSRYNADEIVEARSNRFDSDTAAEFRQRANAYIEEMDENSLLWDRLIDEHTKANM